MMLLEAFLALFALHSALAIPLLPDDERLPRRDSQTIVKESICDGKKYTYEELAGYGFIPSTARDKTGDTLGGFGSSIALDQASWKKGKNGTYTGTLWGIPDRGW